MTTAVKTKKSLDNTSNQYTLQETQGDDISTTLDADGWVIRSPGTLREAKGILLKIVDSNNSTIAAAIIANAEDSQFQQLTHLDRNALSNAIYLNSIWIAPHVENANVLPAILYFALRRARINERHNVVSLVPIPNRQAPLATLLRLDPLDKLKELRIKNQVYLPVAQRLKYSIHLAYQQCHGDMLKLIKQHFIDEIIETHAIWLQKFYHGSWATAVREKTLTKEQYINSLYNLHQYVRQTTRLCARALAFSEDEDLRNHYINHLRGEINHELIIERDLKHLGADVEYLKTAHIPNPATKEFMVVQESTIGFYQDPVLMLACPLAAEGVAANMAPEFLGALYETIGTWGVKEPKEAARFLSSHVHTDGGDDGHWQAVINVIKQFVTDETKLQQFLSVLIAATNGFEHGFNANIDELKLWEAVPQKENSNEQRTQ